MIFRAFTTEQGLEYTLSKVKYHKGKDTVIVSFAKVRNDRTYYCIFL